MTRPARNLEARTQAHYCGEESDAKILIAIGVLAVAVSPPTASRAPCRTAMEVSRYVQRRPAHLLRAAPLGSPDEARWPMRWATLDAITHAEPTRPEHAH